jgi:hypothetical protein
MLTDGLAPRRGVPYTDIGPAAGILLARRYTAREDRLRPPFLLTLHPLLKLFALSIFYDTVHYLFDPEPSVSIAATFKLFPRWVQISVPPAPTLSIRATQNAPSDCDPIGADVRYRVNQLCIFFQCPWTRTCGLVYHLELH